MSRLSCRRQACKNFLWRQPPALLPSSRRSYQANHPAPYRYKEGCPDLDRSEDEHSDRNCFGEPSVIILIYERFQCSFMSISNSLTQPNVVAGRIFTDVNANGRYDSPPDIPFANKPIVLVLASPNRRMMGRAVGCPNTISEGTTDTNGEFNMGFGVVQPGSQLEVFEPTSCETPPLASFTANSTGFVQANESFVDIPLPVSTLTATATATANMAATTSAADTTSPTQATTSLTNTGTATATSETQTETTRVVSLRKRFIFRFSDSSPTRSMQSTSWTVSTSSTASPGVVPRLIMKKRSSNIVPVRPDDLQDVEPIEQNLHVVAVFQNPAGFKHRVQVAKSFLKRMRSQPNVKLYVVELVYGPETPFQLTKAQYKRHLQLRTNGAPIWSKENLINIGINTLLPKNWQSVAWVDMEVAFDSSNWVTDTLKMLNGKADFVQPFTTAHLLDRNGTTQYNFLSFPHHISEGLVDGKVPSKVDTGKETRDAAGNKAFHPGLAWACSKKAYEQLGGLLETSILGSGDNVMAHSFFGAAKQALPKGLSADFKEPITAWQQRTLGLRMGYIDGAVRHEWHGERQHRRYSKRWRVLARHKFSPAKHLIKRADGLLEPSEACPRAFLLEVGSYFVERNEDGEQ